MGRDNRLIDLLFRGQDRKYGQHLKALKKRTYKRGIEVSQHYANQLAERRAERLGFTCTQLTGDFEALLIHGDFQNLSGPVAFESKWVTEAESLPYRVREYAYGARASGAKSCLIVLYDALKKVSWTRVAALEQEASTILPTRIVSFETFTGRIIPTPLLRDLYTKWARDQPQLGQEQAASFQDLSRVEQIKRDFSGAPVSLLVGAGSTMAAGGPSWYGLINRLWLDELRGRYRYPRLSDADAVSELGSVIGDSVLIQARLLKRLAGPGFIDKVREGTYRGVQPDSETPRQVARLALALHRQSRLRHLITFNYDSLIEDAINAEGVAAHAVYRETRTSGTGIPVQHVHGYLPRPPQPITPEEAASVVFDEETYHSRFNRPEHWTNRVMLSALKESCCVFIGFSMNDPNVRRLMEQAREADQVPHVVLLRQPPLDGDNPDAQLARARLIHTQEEVLRELGLRVLWYANYSDLPAMLDLLIPD